MSAVALALTATGCCGANANAADAQTARTTSFVDESRHSGYSEAVRYGDLVWTAGHLPQSASPGDDIATQTKAVMEGLKATLSKAGASFDTVVMTNVYLTDFNDWPEFNDVYESYFPNHLPPRTTTQISGLAFGNIEISMVAYTRSS
jgi:2-iminobutanoate/2-iminopropanoate deaminase